MPSFPPLRAIHVQAVYISTLHTHSTFPHHHMHIYSRKMKTKQANSLSKSKWMTAGLSGFNDLMQIQSKETSKPHNHSHNAVRCMVNMQVHTELREVG